MRERRSYLGYTICQSLFSSRWIIRLGRTHIGSAPSAFDAVELVEQLVDAKAIDMMLRQGEPLVADSPSRRQERYDAINGKNPSPATLAENLARASLAVKRDIAELRGGRSVDDRAPTPPDEMGLDQENAARAVVDANASSSSEINAFLNHPPIAALRQEERVLSLKLAEQVADDPEAFRTPVGATGETEALESGSEALRSVESDRPLWSALKGIQNTVEILTRKGEIISKLISMSLEDGESAASTVTRHNSSVISISTQSRLDARAEIAAFLLYIIDRYMRKFVEGSERAVMIQVIEDNMKQKLQTFGYDRVDFSQLFGERYAEYVKYRRWSIEINQEGRPLLWDFSRKIGEVFGTRNNFLFNLVLTNLLLKRISDWDLRRLLRGE